MSDDAGITFDCPHCQQPLKGESDMGGETIHCPKCRKAVTVPVPRVRLRQLTASPSLVGHPTSGKQLWLTLLVGFTVAFVFGLSMHLWLASRFWTLFAAVFGFVAVVVPLRLWTRLRGAPAPATTNPTNGYRTSGSHRPCPFCGEQILTVAIKCKHCGEFLEKRPAKEDGPAEPLQSAVPLATDPKCVKRVSTPIVLFVTVGIGLLLALLFVFGIVLVDKANQPPPTTVADVQRGIQEFTNSLSYDALRERQKQMAVSGMPLIKDNRTPIARPQDLIIGTWTWTGTWAGTVGRVTILNEFRKDGVVKVVQGGIPFEATYRFVDNKDIEYVIGSHKQYSKIESITKDKLVVINEQGQRTEWTRP